MLEIEQKFARVDLAALEARLRQLGAGGPVVHDEADQYFNAPDRDFATTGEAFRLRRIDQANWLTYKGPRQAGPVKIRPELEIPLPPGDEAAQQHTTLLQHLGYRPVAVVAKRRSSFTLRSESFDVTICLDDVAELGTFAEVEVLAAPEDAERASTAIARLAQQLGLTEVEPRSYLTLLLAQRARGDQARQPVVVTTGANLRAALAEVRRRQQSVGFVPTMGALHEGHASLLRAARARNEYVVASIFVNPTQFGPHEDLARYPRPFEADLRMCAACGVDLVFHPAPEEIYPPGYRTYVEVTGLQDILEGAIRPGHFRGVATVVLKLLLLVQPTRLYLGQKDAQQVRIVQQMIQDLAVPVQVVVCPTIREADGLALSSRNCYLDPDQRESAGVLHAALQAASERFQSGERTPEVLEQAMRQQISSRPDARMDYAVALDADTWAAPTPATRAWLLALAVRFGPTRLIDNLRLEVG